MRILALSDSLRAASSNTAVLKAAALLAPAGVEVRLYDGMANLPHYNPDLDDTVDGARVPPIAQDLRTSVEAADALLIACPEYAHGARNQEGAARWNRPSFCVSAERLPQMFRVDRFSWA
ncbi:NADPH-dependent FMN reductase [Nitrospirillum viridazoti]|uniref:NADPH-dependent FMN reductase n=2 Tax=Nitrospirillum TaxID=1543705 RepID=A0A560IWJ0_9PROT|nr:NAD(P)H-dependent oxidoreductase [Nitrospirillum amazonense]TWB63423.1 NADPH-dependent FMN reductase [Nitrospirillum amazonense]